jgi:hypothetical protein
MPATAATTAVEDDKRAAAAAGPDISSRVLLSRTSVSRESEIGRKLAGSLAPAFAASREREGKRKRKRDGISGRV